MQEELLLSHLSSAWTNLTVERSLRSRV